MLFGEKKETVTVNLIKGYLKHSLKKLTLNAVYYFFVCL